jgi:hypothetical protein
MTTLTGTEIKVTLAEIKAVLEVDSIKLCVVQTVEQAAEMQDSDRLCGMPDADWQVGDEYFEITPGSLYP